MVDLVLTMPFRGPGCWGTVRGIIRFVVRIESQVWHVWWLGWCRRSPITVVRVIIICGKDLVGGWGRGIYVSVRTPCRMRSSLSQTDLIWSTNQSAQRAK